MDGDAEPIVDGSHHGLGRGESRSGGIGQYRAGARVLTHNDEHVNC